MLIHWIWLATRHNITERAKQALLDGFHDPEEVYFADQSAYRSVEGLTPEGMEALADKDLVPSADILQECNRKGIHICTMQDAAYPSKLKNIADPPLVLYYKGNLAPLDEAPVIGIVGTRKATAYGMTTGKKMGYQIAKCGGIVVSGVASGVDGMAMRGALTAGGYVVGILGCGADVVYPMSNKSLYADTESRGCLLTEFPPGTPPYGWNFPKRNRLISGLSNGVLVVEAPEGSDALITAKLAADQGRDVFVVPGNIDVPTCVGSNALLRDGAISVSTGWDVVSEYEMLYPGRLQKNTGMPRLTAYADEVMAAALETEKEEQKVAQKPRKVRSNPKNDRKIKNIPIDNVQKESYSDPSAVLQDLSQQERALLENIQDACLIDDVIEKMDCPASEVLSTLTLLEIKGIVKQLPGGRIKLK